MNRSGKPGAVQELLKRLSDATYETVATTARMLLQACMIETGLLRPHINYGEEVEA